MKIKMVCCDVDGTILKNDQTVSEKTKKAIFELRKKGYEFVLVSGRNIEGMEMVWKQLPFVGYSVCCNGNCVFDSKGKLLYENSYNIDEFKSFLTLLEKEKIEMFVSCSAFDYVEEHLIHADNNWIRPFKVIKNYEYTNNIDDVNFNKISLHIVNKKQVEKIVIFIKNQAIQVVKAENEFYDIVLRGHEKKDGVCFLLKRLKISNNEVLFIGDNENDISMLQYAGIGVAMRNASDDVKKYADFICESNQNDGVARTIECFVL